MATFLDVPFKTPEEIQSTIEKYEKEFQDRYTEADPWYRITLEERQR